MRKLLWTTSSFGSWEVPSGFTLSRNPHGRRLSEAEAAALLAHENSHGLIAGVEPLTEEVMQAAPNLRVISRCGIGLENVDLSAAKRLGIEVRNTPEAPVDSVAELTLGLILALLRRIPENDGRVRNGDWKGRKGRLLKGKTVGIVGCGRIGSAVATLLPPFGVSILGHDPFLSAHETAELVSLDRLLQESDIITLHLAATEKTRHLVDASFLTRTKQGTFLVNAARGSLVDEVALHAALESGQIGGAALDVFEVEPYQGPLCESRNVILSPHEAASALEARERMEREALDNAVEVLRSSPAMG